MHRAEGACPSPGTRTHSYSIKGPNVLPSLISLTSVLTWKSYLSLLFVKQFQSKFTMKALALLVLAAVLGVVLSYGDVEEHEHRIAKRSPYDPLLPALLLGKSFLLGALVGPKVIPRVRYGGWGGGHYAPRYVYNAGWGWDGR